MPNNRPLVSTEVEFLHPQEYATLRAGSQAQPIDDEALLSTAQVRAWVGNVSAMCLWRWSRDERVRFPAPDVVINGRKYWYAGTIRRFSAGRAAKAAA
jgi:hypothetical protein